MFTPFWFEILFRRLFIVHSVASEAVGGQWRPVEAAKGTLLNNHLKNQLISANKFLTIGMSIFATKKFQKSTWWPLGRSPVSSKISNRPWPGTQSELMRTSKCCFLQGVLEMAKLVWFWCLVPFWNEIMFRRLFIVHSVASEAIGGHWRPLKGLYLIAPKSADFGK